MKFEHTSVSSWCYPKEIDVTRGYGSIFPANMETDVRGQEEEEEDLPRVHYEEQQQQESVAGETEADAAADSTPAVEPSAPPLDTVTTSAVKHKVVLTVQELPTIKRVVSSALRLNRRMAYEIKEVAEHEMQDAARANTPDMEEATMQAVETELDDEEEEDDAPPGARTRRRAATALQELGSVDDHQMAAEGSPPSPRSRRKKGAWWRLFFRAKKEAAGESNPPEPHQEEH